MYPVTRTVAENFKQNAVQYLSILVNPVTGSSFELTDADVLANGLNINRYSANGDSVALGTCVAAELTLEIENTDGRFNSVQFEGAQLTVSIGTQDGDNVGWVPLGLFTVDTAPRKLDTLSIVALDGMVLFDKPVNLDALNLPAQVKNIVRACCNECNIVLDTDLDALPNSSYVVNSVGDTEDLTYRQILIWCCQLMGVCGFMDWQGHLELSWYKKDGIPESVSGELASFVSYTEIPITTLNVPVTPYQNLNGYDHPWVGGAGTNILDYNEWKTLSVTTTHGTAVWENNGVSLTATANDCYTQWQGNAYKLPVTEGETITLAWEYTTTGSSGNMYIFPNGATTGMVNTTANTKKLSYTVGSGITYVTFRFGVALSGTTIKYSNIQIFKGSGTTPSWTPYENICPIYPANGKNLFSGTLVNGQIGSNGGYSSSTSRLTNVSSSSELGDYLSAGTYTISAKAVVSANALTQVTVLTKDSSLNVIDNFATSWHNLPFTFTLSSDGYVCFTLRPSTGDLTPSNYVAQIERGSVATTYVPYKGFEVTRTGKNLLPFASNGTRHTVTFTVATDGKVTVNGTPTSTASYLLNNIKLKANTSYMLSGCPNGGGKDKWGLGFYDGSSWIANDWGDGVSFTPTEDVEVEIRIRYWYHYAISDLVFAPQIEIGSTATSYEPYQGEQFCNLNYNMWDEQWELGDINESTGNNRNSALLIRSTNYIPVKPSTTYYFYVGSSKNANAYYYDANKTFISYTTISGNASFTVPATAYYMRFRMAQGYGTTYKNDIIINYSNPSQVGYGGTLDVTTGLLTVTHNAVDMGSLTWASQSGNWKASVSGHRSMSASGIQSGLICDGYKAVVSAYNSGPTGVANGDIWEYVGSNAVLCKNDTYSSASDFTTSVTGMRLVYPLATPRTYQLTGTQVTALLGQNNIWTDSKGTINVTFPAITTITPADRFSSDVYENPITITGVSVKGEENEALCGSDEYALLIEGNDLITDDDVETVANNLAGLVGFSYYPFQASTLPMPYLYPLDMVAVQYRGDWYDGALTEVSFTASNATDLKSAGKTTQSRSYARLNPLTNRERAIIENLKGEINETLNLAINQAIDFNQIISNALGLYSTNISDGAGGFIRYLHDAPNLEDSTYIVTETAQGFAWTQNGWNGGSPVWSYGVTSGGYALFKWLSAEGIDVTKASSDYRAQVTPEYFNIYYKNDLIITVDATERAIKTPRMLIPYSATSNNMLRVGNAVWLPAPNGANLVVLEG